MSHEEMVGNRNKIYVNGSAVPNPDYCLQEINSMCGIPANPSECVTVSTMMERPETKNLADSEEYSSKDFSASVMQKKKVYSLLTLNVDKLKRRRA